MDNLPVIHELKEVIKPALNCGSLFSYEVSSLTQPGDNYGSVLISVLAKIELPDGKLCHKKLVAKVPPSDPKYWQFIQPERTCLTENAIYKILAPELSILQTEAGIPEYKHFDGFAQYFGSRISLIPESKAVDRDAILLLDDLRESNYVAGHRKQPFDLSHTQLALEYMAQFHALTIALRIKKPELFKMKIRPFFNKFDWHAAAPESKETMIAETLTDICEATNDDQTMVEHVRKLSYEFFKFLEAPPIESNRFNCIIHSDFWIMNLMFRHGKFFLNSSGKPTHMKIIDFQTAQFDSVIHDLISFLLTSISTSVLEDHYQYLLQIYYNAFINSLKSVGVDTSDFSYESFHAELKRIAYIQVPHSIFMTRFILADDTESIGKEVDLLQILKKTSSKHVHRKLSDILRLAQKFEILY
ncbi:hypothetical protein KR222_008532 [Zaprionus bogoriensis]|nr:hypothetical protein KR222_008532 [Zaprionus bogoriensis]